MMKKLIRELVLPNGLTVDIFDRTHRYFGDYHHVKIEFNCTVPVLSELFEQQSQFDEARSLVGETVLYKRLEERMGVPSADISMAQERLITNFIEHSLPYVSSDQFPRKIVLSELKNKKIKVKKQLNAFH